jgi:hypothetical protein
MEADPSESLIFEFVLQVERFYAALVWAASPVSVLNSSDSGPGLEPGLDGKLLYAGELNEEGRALVVASNIAGAASLAASADPTAQKQAIRDGVIDFLVTNLDEALRILKNEIRKRQPVSVCVAASPPDVESEMLERGVLPDLLAPSAASVPCAAGFLAQGLRQIGLPHSDQMRNVLTWTVSAAPAQWLPKLDAIALDCLSPGDATGRRWLRLSPRYLGRLAQGMRLLACDQGVAARFIDQSRNKVHLGEIGVQVEICWRGANAPEVHRLLPPKESDSAD